MKRILIFVFLILYFSVGLLVGVFIASPSSFDSLFASAEVYPYANDVLPNCITLDDPRLWQYNLDWGSGYRQVDTGRNNFYLFNSGSTQVSLVGNVLKSDTSGDSSKIANLRIPILRDNVLQVVSAYNERTNFNVTTCTFTVLYEVVSGMGSCRVWGSSTETGGVSGITGASIDNTSGLKRLTFDVYNNVYTYYNLIIQAFGTINIYGFKLEVGNSFNGFIYDDYQVNGYDFGYTVGYNDAYDAAYSLGYDSGLEAGYDAGFFDGTQAYAYRSFTVPFNNVESPNIVNGGWAEMGITSTSDLYASVFSLTSDWFDSQGYPVVSQGYFFDTDNGYAYVWISPFICNVSNFRQQPIYCELKIQQHSTYLSLVDPDLPNPWNPVQYPNVRVVNISVQMGLDQWITKVQDNASVIGYNQGIQQGKQDGYDIGYNEGYSRAMEYVNNGSWRSMFSALIGVPVTFIMSFFNFNLFGFNFLTVLQVVILLSLLFFVFNLMRGKFKS